MKSTDYRNTHTYPLTKEKGQYRPKLPVRIINFETGQSIDAMAVIDTGSESCVFPDLISNQIGHVIDENSLKKKGVKGISGKEVETHVHPFTIELLDSVKKNSLRSISVVGYTVRTGTLPPILGTYMFLELFEISIDYPRAKIVVRW